MMTETCKCLSLVIEIQPPNYKIVQSSTTKILQSLASNLQNFQMFNQQFV